MKQAKVLKITDTHGIIYYAMTANGDISWNDKEATELYQPVDGYKYVARDENGVLCAYKKEPVKDLAIDEWHIAQPYSSGDYKRVIPQSMVLLDFFGEEGTPIDDEAESTENGNRLTVADLIGLLERIPDKDTLVQMCDGRFVTEVEFGKTLNMTAAGERNVTFVRLKE